MPARRAAARDAGIAVYTAENEGVNDEGLPTGLLMWGQAAAYNAVDDRFLVAALCADKGVVRPAVLTPGAGLTVNVAAGWLAIASCEDGTRAAIGSRQTHQVTIPAGGTSALTCYLWCDTDPDAGTWTLRVLTQGETIGRPGVSLARIDIPAGANLATQVSFSQMVPTLGHRCEATWRETTSTATVDLTPRYAIAPHQIQPHRAWKITAWGGGTIGTTATNPYFEAVSGSQAASAQGAQGSGILNFDIAGGAADVLDFPRLSEIAWAATCIMQINPGRDLIRLVCQVNMSNATRVGYRYRNSISGVRGVSLTRIWAADWYWLCLRGRWGGNAASERLVCYGSSFEMMEPYR